MGLMGHMSPESQYADPWPITIQLTDTLMRRQYWTLVAVSRPTDWRIFGSSLLYRFQHSLACPLSITLAKKTGNNFVGSVIRSYVSRTRNTYV